MDTFAYHFETIFLSSHDKRIICVKMWKITLFPEFSVKFPIETKQLMKKYFNLCYRNEMMHTEHMFFSSGCKSLSLLLSKCDPGYKSP